MAQPKNLVIVESPKKAKNLGGFLGKDYLVMSSEGHIRDLKKKNFGVDLDTFRPEYEITQDKRQTVSELRATAKKAETVWLASDEDREGEAIAWHLAEVLGLDPETTHRIVFHEISKPAILAAIAHPRTIDLRLVDAQQARRVLDRLVGFKLSPVLWRKVKLGLSAGRVQSVALRLTVERERELQAFEQKDWWKVSALLRTASGGELRAELSHRFESEAQAREYMERTAGSAYSVSEVNTRPASRRPAPPFTTSTLQQEAARKLGLSVATTMRLAQSLYEAGLITYMRTDSMNLSTICTGACRELITQELGERYHKEHHYHTSAKGAQEAHEAIRPTEMKRRTGGATAGEKRLYDLIWKRTLACQMADAQLERTTVSISTQGSELPLQCQGEVVTFDGFLRVYQRSPEEIGRELGEGEKPIMLSGARLLPHVEQGETLAREELTATQRFSNPPARYDEAALVSKMEELGIGRPSTYATTVTTIQQRGYVEKSDREPQQRTVGVLSLGEDGALRRSEKSEAAGGEKGKLVPTDIGLVVSDYLLEKFPEIMDYNFTANVEKDFDLVAEGEKEWTGLIREFYAHFDPQVERIMEEQGGDRVGQRRLGSEPKTGEPVYVKIGRYGAMVQIGDAGSEEKPRFATLPKTLSLETVTLEQALELFRLPRTLGESPEGGKVVANTGRFGPYVQLGRTYASIPKDEDPLHITLERALELVSAKQEAVRKSHIKSFSEDADMEIRTGRFGPYIAYQGKNYKIPKTQAATAAELSHEQCLTIIEEDKKRPARGRKAKK